MARKIESTAEMNFDMRHAERDCTYAKQYQQSQYDENDGWTVL
jgi:hypothetical protein